LNEELFIVVVTFCKLIDGIIKFGSRGMNISNGLSIVVVNWISLSFSSKYVNEINREKLVFNEDLEFPKLAKGSNVD
jgi:hypothetical protein